MSATPRPYRIGELKTIGSTVYQLVENPEPRKGRPAEINLFSATVQNDNGLLTDAQVNAITEHIRVSANCHDELLAALKESVSIIADRSAGGQMITPIDRAKSVLGKVVAAIKKAEASHD